MADEKVITEKMLMDLIKGMQSSHEKQVEAMQAQTNALIAKMDEPERLKKQKEAETREMARQIRVSEAAEEEALLQRIQSGCRHKKSNGQSNIAGQICSDGYVYSFCAKCKKKMPSFKAPLEWIQRGAPNFQNADVFPNGVDEAWFELWQKEFGASKPVQPVRKHIVMPRA